MLKKLRSVDNKWFFTDLPTWCKNLAFVFVKGDTLVLLPLLALILMTGFFSLKFMLLILGLYIAIRHFGEMIYWLLQQFGDRKYRPGDFGFKNLDNNAIYILYQTIAIAWVVFGIAIVFFAQLYVK